MFIMMYNTKDEILYKHASVVDIIDIPVNGINE